MSRDPQRYRDEFDEIMRRTELRAARIEGSAQPSPKIALPSALVAPRPEDFGLTQRQALRMAERAKPKVQVRWGLQDLFEAGFGIVFACFMFVTPWVILWGVFGPASFPEGIFIGPVILLVSIPGHYFYWRIKDRSFQPAFQKYREAVRIFDEKVQRERQEEEERKKQRQAELRKQLDWWHALDGISFERELATLLRAKGHKAELTPATGDGGIDLIVQRSGQRILAIQCKAHKTPIGVEAVRAFYGALKHHESVSRRPVEGWIVAKAGYSQQAIRFAHGKLWLRDIRELL